MMAINEDLQPEIIRGKKSYSAPKSIVESPQFCTKLIPVNSHYSKEMSHQLSFHIYMCVEGSCLVNVNGWRERLTKGQTILVPANAESIEFIGSEAQLLEVTMPSSMELQQAA